MYWPFSLPLPFGSLELYGFPTELHKCRRRLQKTTRRIGGLDSYFFSFKTQIPTKNNLERKVGKSLSSYLHFSENYTTRNYSEKSWCGWIKFWKQIIHRRVIQKGTTQVIFYLWNYFNETGNHETTTCYKWKIYADKHKHIYFTTRHKKL